MSPEWKMLKAQLASLGPILGIAAAVVMTACIAIGFVLSSRGWGWLWPVSLGAMSLGLCGWIFFNRRQFSQPKQIESAPASSMESSEVLQIESAPSTSRDLEPGDLIATTRLDPWWKLGADVIVTFIVLVGLILTVSIGRDNLAVKVIILCISLGIILIPFTDGARKTFHDTVERWRRWRLRLLVIVVVSIAMLVVAVLLTGLNLVPVLTTAATWTWDAIRFLTKSFAIGMTVILAIALIKLSVVVYDWRINNLSLLHAEHTGTYPYNIELEEGVFIPRKSPAIGEKLTSIVPLPIFQIFGLSPSWCSLRLEDPGQQQAITYIHGVPRAFLKEMSGVSEPVVKQRKKRLRIRRASRTSV